MKLPRMWEWVLVTVILVAVLWLIRVPTTADYLAAIGVPGDIIVLVHKAATTTLFGLGGAWFDRSVFPYGRPDQIVRDPADGQPWSIGDATAFNGACLRRSIIIVGSMCAGGLGL
jgi:hypothetical protein